MSTNYKQTLIVASAIVIFIVAQSLYSSRVNDETKISAKVVNVSEGGLKDIVVGLQGIRGIHYISKSNTKGLKVDKLNELLSNKEINLTYIRPGIVSKISPGTETRLISQIELGDSIIYSRSN